MYILNNTRVLLLTLSITVAASYSRPVYGDTIDTGPQPTSLPPKPLIHPDLNFHSTPNQNLNDHQDSIDSVTLNGGLESEFTALLPSVKAAKEAYAPDAFSKSHISDHLTEQANVMSSSPGHGLPFNAGSEPLK